MGRAKRKPKPPLPPEHVAYYQARANLRRNIRRFRRLQFSEHGARWIQSQIAYWERRLNELRLTAPLGTDDNPGVD